MKTLAIALFLLLPLFVIGAVEPSPIELAPATEGSTFTVSKNDFILCLDKNGAIQIGLKTVTLSDLEKLNLQGKGAYLRIDRRANAEAILPLLSFLEKQGVSRVYFVGVDPTGSHQELVAFSKKMN